MKIRVFKPFIKRKDMDSILTCIVSDAMGDGNERKRFLELAKEHFACDFAAAFRESSAALGYAIDALQLEDGSGVIISPLSPAYYAVVIQNRGLKTLYADVSPTSGAMLRDAVEERIRQGGRAIVVHETFGILPDIEGLKSLGFPVIEDITQSIGAHNGELTAGASGTYVLASLESNDIITAGGGALLFARERRDATLLRKALETAPDDVYLSDMNASLACTQIKGLAVTLERRRELTEVYGRALAATRHKMPVPEGDGEAGYWSFPVIVASGVKDVATYAAKKEVETRLQFESCALAVMPLEACPCPNAQSLMLRSILFPLYPGMGKAQVEKIAKILGTLP